VLKYAEPPEARKPVRNWRLYVFKGKEQVGASLSPLTSASSVRDDLYADLKNTISMRRTLPRAPAVVLPLRAGPHRASASPSRSLLLDCAVLTPCRLHLQVADIPVDHPSASKQHAVLQFRQVTERNEFGDTKSLTKCVPLALALARSLRLGSLTLELDEQAFPHRPRQRQRHDGQRCGGPGVALLRAAQWRRCVAPFLAVSRRLLDAGRADSCLLSERAVLKFAFSSREYVLLVEQ